MKYQWLKFYKGQTVSQDDGGDLSNGGGSSVRNPDKLLEHYENLKAEYKEFKSKFAGIDPSTVQELLDFKKQADLDAKDREQKALAEEKRWAELYQQKEADLKANYQKEIDSLKASYESQIQKLSTDFEATQKERETIQNQFTELQQKQTELQRTTAIRGLVEADLDPAVGLDYFLFKFGDRFSQGEDGSLLFTNSKGEKVDPKIGLDEIKKDPGSSLFWKGITPEGSGVTPGAPVTTGTTPYKTTSIVEVPRAALGNPEKLRTIEGVDPANIRKQIATGAVKIVD